MKYSKDYSEYNDSQLIRLTILIPKDIREKIREMSFKEHRTMTDIVIEAIEKYIDSRDQEQG